LASKSKHNQELNQFKTQITNLKQEVADCLLLSDENTDLKSRIDSLESSQNKSGLDSQLIIQQKESEIKKLTGKLDEITLLKQKIQDSDSIITEKYGEISTLNQNILNIQSEHSQNLKSKISEFDNKFKTLRDQYESEKDEMSQQFDLKSQQLEQNLKNVGDKLKRVTTEKLASEQKLQSQIQELENEHKERVDQMESDHTDDLGRLKSKLDQKTHDYEKLKQTLDDERSTTNAQLSQTEMDLKSKLDSATNEILGLKSHLEAANDQVSDQKSRLE
jgi:chromosome segregation ATPase